MRKRRSKLDRHAAELLALRRAGANLAQLARWLRFRPDTVVATTTVGRWLDRAQDRSIDALDIFSEEIGHLRPEVTRLYVRQLSPNAARKSVSNLFASVNFDAAIDHPSPNSSARRS